MRLLCAQMPLLTLFAGFIVVAMLITVRMRVAEIMHFDHTQHFPDSFNPKDTGKK